GRAQARRAAFRCYHCGDVVQGPGLTSRAGGGVGPGSGLTSPGASKLVILLSSQLLRPEMKTGEFTSSGVVPVQSTGLPMVNRITSLERLESFQPRGSGNAF